MRTRLIRLLLTFVLVVPSTSGCALLLRAKQSFCSTGQQCATIILTDFGWGIDATFGSDPAKASDVKNVHLVIDSAIAAVAAHPGDWRAITIAALTSIQQNVDTPTAWIPSINAALAIIPLIPKTSDEV